MPLDTQQLVTMFEARIQVRQAEGNPQIDADIEIKLAQATGTILSYLNTTEHWRAITATWTESTVPQPVHDAILAQLGAIYVYRGGSDASDIFDENGLVKRAAGLLRLYRDPVIA
jgi:hypothetical protein